MYRVYGVPNCPNCERAKRMILDAGFEPIYVDISQSESILKDFQSKGLREMPQVFIDDTHIGNVNALKTHLLEVLDV
jgi:glutaredoxin